MDSCSVEKDVTYIKEWLKKEPHLPNEFGVERHVQPPNVANAFKVALMFADLRLKGESEEVDGDVYILDADVATVNHFARFTPMLIKKFLLCIQASEAYPIKLKQVHVINISPIVEKIINFVMPFLKEKIRQRVFVHTDVNDLYKHVPQEIMPTDYGGKVGSMNDIYHAWIKKTEESKGWFSEQDKYRSDESRRPGRPKNHDELFGLTGSFRQLDID
ncbi:Alpha-tocopherol transfer protein [Danaus plexippus plexippus]|uniref:Alpha-tocopherol transfer protein n=1 Tax=Danaus plexippus plexippus TaxID=278856 RepID=A0A212FMH2_DANPL|nr:Alpha-tocopherol transfer protein [Danaus plexippus plexippus]